MHLAPAAYALRSRFGPASVLVAGRVYGLLLTIMLVVTGEVSCDEVCSPASEFLNDAYPFPMIAAIAVSLAAAFRAVRRKRSHPES